MHEDSTHSCPTQFSLSLMSSQAMNILPPVFPTQVCKVPVSFCQWLHLLDWVQFLSLFILLNVCFYYVTGGWGRRGATQAGPTG